METTRRDALLGGAVAAGMAAAAGSAAAQQPKFPKVIFSMAGVTPCDRSGWPPR